MFESTAGDFIVDDDGMGYADIGEEEDWGKSTDTADRNSNEQVTSKKRKDHGVAGSIAFDTLFICIATLPCYAGACDVNFYVFLQTPAATSEKVPSRIRKLASVCKACLSERLCGLLPAMLLLSSPLMIC